MKPDWAKQMSDREIDMRIDLAAAHRMAVIHGFSEGIFNHLTALVPGKPDRFLVIPFGMHWSEAQASTLLESDFERNVTAGVGKVESSAYYIHVPIHQARQDAPCVFHTHMPYASALARLEDPCIQAIGQTEISFMDEIAYDTNYSGFARDLAEGERMAKVLGKKNILFLGNHGVIVMGRTVGEAYDRLYYLERAAQVQLFAMWTNRPLKYIPDDVRYMTSQQFSNSAKYDGKPNYDMHFDALKRLLVGETIKKSFAD